MSVFRLAAILALGSTVGAAEGEWTRFRGPNGTGISEAATVPAKWTERDYNWKVKLPGIGYLKSCPLCGGGLEDAGRAPRVVQQVEIIDVPIRIEEHRGLAYWCPSCQKFHYAPLPPEVEQGQLFGPRLTTLVAYMKGVCHASFSTIRKFIRDVVGIKVSRGYLRKLIGKMSDALKPCYDELLAALPNANTLNIDETGHKENGDRFWTWCFRAEMYTLFRIDKSRGSKVLIDVLGEEFDGVITCR